MALILRHFQFGNKCQIPHVLPHIIFTSSTYQIFHDSPCEEENTLSSLMV